MSRIRRPRWGPTPGQGKVQAALERDSRRFHLELVAGFVAFGAVLSVLHHCSISSADHRVGPPTREVSQRQWHGDPGRY